MDAGRVHPPSHGRAPFDARPSGRTRPAPPGDAPDAAQAASVRPELPATGRCPSAWGLSDGDVICPVTASLALGLEPKDGVAWLERCGLVRDIAGVPRVLWGQVLRAVMHAPVYAGRNPPAPAPASTESGADERNRVGGLAVPEVARRFGPSRATIYRLLAACPAPMTFGTGSRRIPRWPDEDSYLRWLGAAQEDRRRGTNGQPRGPERRRPGHHSNDQPVDFGELARELTGKAPREGRGNHGRR